MALKKKDMIETLQAQYESWHAVYDLFNGKIKGAFSLLAISDIINPQ
jgi:hypothetical protein